MLNFIDIPFYVKKICSTSKGTFESTNPDSEAQEMVKPSRDMFILGTLLGAHPRYLGSMDAIWGRCSLVISPWGSDSEAFHSAEKKGIIPGGVFGIHQMATTGNVELTGRLLGVIGVM